MYQVEGGLFDDLILTKFYNPIVRKDLFPIYFSTEYTFETASM